jgi:6-phosphofructokinase 1
MKRIGIITGGGDCGGLNAVIKGAALMGLRFGIQSFIVPNGYSGLYNLVGFDKLLELTADRVDFVNSVVAGSECGHSRVKIKKIKDENRYERIKEGLKKFEIDGLVISGGDDTGSVMVDLAEQGIKCIHAPKTMDLDLQPYSVGFDSTVNRIETFAQDIKTTGRTHNRIIVMELFGRYAGHTAFRAGIAAEADAILIPEIAADMDVVYEHCKTRYMARIASSDIHSGTYLILVSEGLKDASGRELVDETAPVDAFGHRRLAGAGKYVGNELTRRLKNDASVREFMKREKMFVEGLYEAPEVRVVEPGHLIRCGNSSVYDVNFGKEAGASAVVLLTKGLSGYTVIGMHHGRIHYMETAAAIEQRYVDLKEVAFYEHLGYCFGREPEETEFEFEEEKGPIERLM